MNAGLTLTVWLQLFGLLAVEMVLVVGAAALISRFVASAAWRRTVWQICVLSLLALTLFELTGTARSVASWLAVKVSPENRAAARTTAANRSNEHPASGQLTEGFRRKVAEQLAQENQHKSVETAESTLPVIQPSGTDTQPATAPTDPRPKQNPPSSAEAGGDSATDLLPILWLELIWLVGAGLVIARSCLAHVLFLLFRHRCQTVSDAELLGRVKAVAQLLGIKRRVHLVESSRLAGPIVFGVFRPVIGLPTGFTTRYSPVQQEAMLAHELAHLAAHDPVWYLLANWASAILWWHPAVWWTRRQLHSASEQAADEVSLVVADGPRVLAECLVEMGARLTQQRSFVWMGVEGNGLRSGLGRRVERLIHLRGNASAAQGRLRPALAKVFGPAALVATVILSTAWAGPQAFTKGESMKTMRQTWSHSLAAFALLTSLGTDNQIALAGNADQRASEKNATPAEAKSTSAAEKPIASDPTNKPATEEPSQLQNTYYRRIMERYGAMPNPRTKKGPIAPKLEKIVLDEVMFDGVPLAEVLRFLDEESRKRDPDKKGINFLINPNATQSTVIDPQTGQAIAVPPPEPVDMNSVIVRFNLPLRNVRLKDVLDAIVRVADKPIEYSIEEYGVLFSQAANQWADPTAALAAKSLEAAPLQVRTFKVDADKLLPGLKRAFGIDLEGLPFNRSNRGSASPDNSVENFRKELESLEKTLTNLLTQFTDQSLYVVKVRAQIAALKESMKGKFSGELGDERQIQAALRRLLTQLGVNMDVPGKALFYNDLTGILMVRATTEDLAIVQGAVETLGGVANAQWPQAGPGGEGATSSAADLMRQRYWPRSTKK